MRILNFLTVLCLAIGPLSAAHADQECKADVYAAILRDDGSVFMSAEFSDRRHTTRTQSWEDCYKYAVQNTKILPSTVFLTISDAEGNSANVEASVFVKWSFDDGYWVDSKGEVTTYTDHFVSDAKLGNLKYRENGDIFK